MQITYAINSDANSDSSSGKASLGAVPTADTIADDRRHSYKVRKIVAKRSFCTLATHSPAGWSHAAGVIYQEVDGELWIHAVSTSRKARNVAAVGKVGVGIAFRRLPAGPPFTIHFQAKAEVVAMDDPEAVRLIEAGALKRIVGHGALDMVDGCFIRIRSPKRIHSYGLGTRIIDLIRDPLNNGARTVDLAEGGA